MDTPTVTQRGDQLLLPGLATAHSHAFQRVLRGRTQRRATQAGSFWSWRGLMFHLAELLGPDDLFQIARFAFVELAMSGVTLVGEFHYLHHQPAGTPYPNRTELAEVLIRAAQAAGIRITLIRAAYLRAGYQQAWVAGQRRFADANVDDVLGDVTTLQARYAQQPLVRIGLAAHSIRAVPLAQTIELAHYARAQQLPFHMHICEQPREVAECLAEYGQTPVALLAEQGLVDERFVGIHATHLTAQEIDALGTARATVCLCRTTERDLGDGQPETHALLVAGTRLCVGTDSHASPDAFEEVRAIELDERTRRQQRHAAAEAPHLLEIATRQGYVACGWGEAWPADQVALRASDAGLAGADPNLLADAVIFGATPRAVEAVWVAGQQIVANGVHRDYHAALAGYLATLRRLGLN